MEKSEKLWKVLDWLAELPRVDEVGGVWRPAARMGFVEYGLKLLAGAMMAFSAGLLVALVALLPVIGAVFLVACCPAAVLTIAGAVAFAIGLGWFRKKVQSKSLDAADAERKTIREEGQGMPC